MTLLGWKSFLTKQTIRHLSCWQTATGSLLLVEEFTAVSVHELKTTSLI